MLQSKFRIYLQKKGYSERSIEYWIGVLERFNEYCESKDIRLKKIKHHNAIDYIEYLSKSNKSASINSYITGLRKLYTMLDTRSNPFQDVWIRNTKKVELSNIVEYDRLEKLYQSFNHETQIEVMMKVMVGLIIYQGIHPSELTLLEKEMIKLDEGVIQLPDSNIACSRVLPIDSKQVLLLDRHISSINTEELFTTSRGSRKLNNMLHDLTNRVKAKDRRIVSLRLIRKSVVVNWLKTHDLRRVQYMCGHRYISSTEKYCIHDHEQLRKDVIKYHPMS